MSNREREIQSLRESMRHGSRSERLEALQKVDQDLLEPLLPDLVALTGHWRPEIRVAALRALMFAPADQIAEVIAGAL
ncbi:MAG: hypothetical protein EBZ48_14715, partial [Proteobacteria bacterium]|nr:hypothetical protein [Pseudomonadota bacterium]